VEALVVVQVVSRISQQVQVPELVILMMFLASHWVILTAT
jgi:hypothetical protein